MATRKIQKKMHSALVQMKAEPLMEDLLNSINPRSLTAAFLADDSELLQYEDNIERFCGDILVTIKSYGKLRGKSKEASELKDIIQQILEKNFPEALSFFEPLSDTRKRAPVHEDEEKIENRKSKRSNGGGEIESKFEVNSISSEQKAALKSIIQTLIKDSRAEPFLYPVDKRVFPEYYELVAHPVDLNSIKDQLSVGVYGAVVECLQDLRMIWSNCLSFNADGSSICNTALELSRNCEELIVEKLGPEFAIKGKPGRKRSDTDSSFAKEKAISAPHLIPSQSSTNLVVTSTGDLLSSENAAKRKEMLRIMKELKKLPEMEPFLFPVNIDLAPGYLDFVSKPMDLSSVEKNIKSGKYDSEAKHFQSDLKLIFDNCIAYNMPGSDLFLTATQMKKTIPDLCRNVVVTSNASSSSLSMSSTGGGTEAGSRAVAADRKDGELLKKGKSISVTVSGTTSVKVDPDIPFDAAESSSKRGDKKGPYLILAGTKKIDLSPIGLKMYYVLKAIHKHELAEPFHYPVDISQAPGYLDVVRRPIDISYISTRLLEYEKQDPKVFINDVDLIFDNCMKYNIEGSDLFKRAKVLKAYAQEQYAQAWSDQNNGANTSAVRSGTGEIAKKKSESDTSSGLIANTSSVVQDISVGSLSRNAPDSNKLAATASPTSISSSSELQYVNMLASYSSDQLTELMQKVKLERHPLVQSKAFQLAVENSQVQAPKEYPILTTDEQFEIIQLGDMISTPGYHNQKYIFPLDFACKLSLRLYVVAGTDNVQPDVATPSTFNPEANFLTDQEFIDVDVTNAIVADQPTAKDVAGVGPKFVVKIDSLGVISESTESPLDAWNKLLSFGPQVLTMMGSPLRRCRAVFNRLCCHPEIVPFLEQIPVSGPIGTDYYRMIKAPMWLREIHTRLVEGTYDNEFDFAWDVRLVFINCMNYNAPKSHLYLVAQELMLLFDCLLAHWVYNIQDKSPTDLARGPWDDWQFLRYFDSPNPKENICRTTGRKYPSAELAFCEICEDQYCLSSVGLTTSPSEWRCSRCTAALEETAIILSVADVGNSGNNLRFRDLPQLPYSKDSVSGGFMFFPAPELGYGWCQAIRNNRQGLKNTFLSPLGYQLYSKDEALEHKAFEDSVNENLLISREKEFIEYLTTSSKKRADKLKGRHKKDSALSSRSSARRSVRLGGSAGDDDEEDGAASSSTGSPSKQWLAAEEKRKTSAEAGDLAEEAGQLVCGKLAHFALQPGHGVAFVVAKVQEHALLRTKSNREKALGKILFGGRRVIHADNLPGSGLFGLDHDEIKSFIELHQDAFRCEDYQYSTAAAAREIIAHDLSSELDKREAVNIGQRKLDELLRLESSYWPNIQLEASKIGQQTEPSVANPSTQAVIEHKAGFSTLFPSDISSSEGEMILATWDFLDVVQPLIGSPTFSLSEMIKCMVPLTSWLVTLGQTIFDEVAYLLTSLLLLEMHNVAVACGVDEFEWQTFLQSKPLNVLTWPAIASSIIHALPFSAHVSGCRNEAESTKESSPIEKPVYSASSFLLASCPTTMDDSSYGDIFSLTLQHPLLHYFTNNLLYPHARVVGDAVQSMKDRYIFTNFRESFGLELAEEPFKDEHHALRVLLSFISDLKVLHPIDSLAHSFAAEYLSWYNSLLLRFCIQFSAADDDQEWRPLESLKSAIMELSFDAIAPMNVEHAIDGSSATSEHDYMLKPYLFGKASGRAFKLRTVALDLSLKQTFAEFKSTPSRHQQLLSSRMRAHEALQATLIALRNSDPEVWSKEDKLNVIATLVDQASGTSLVEACIAQQCPTRSADVASPVASVSVLSSSQPNSSELPPFEVVKVTAKMHVKCHFTGLEPKHMPSSQQWVIVPDWLLQPPVSNVGVTSTSSAQDLLIARSDQSNDTFIEDAVESTARSLRGVRVALPGMSDKVKIKGKEIALESVVVALATARVNALRSKLASEEQLNTTIQQLGLMELQPLPAKDVIQETLKLHARIPRAEPLGYDRLGREYWLLGAQENAPLVPLGRTLSSNMTTADPAILVKEPKSGWWGFHNGRHLDALVNSFSISIPCEKVLRSNMAERLHFARRKLYSGTLRFKPSQVEWLSKIVKGEVQNANFKIGLNPTGADTAKALEVMWTRCAEVRSHCHYSEVHKIDDFSFVGDRSARAEKEAHLRRQRKLKEFVQDDAFDLSPSKGWIRNTPMSRIRDLFASTVASRLLADPSVYRAFQDSMQRSIFRMQCLRLNSMISSSLSPLNGVSVPSNALNTITSMMSAKIVSIANAKKALQTEAHDAMNIEDEAIDEYYEDDDDVDAANTSSVGQIGHSHDHLHASPIGTPLKKLRPVEQLHISTGQVLRVHPSGTDAAKFLNVSQSGISLCINGVKPDAFGFKWRYYSGPPINWQEIESSQMSLQEIQRLQVNRRKPVLGADAAATQPSATIGSQTLPDSTAAQTVSRSSPVVPLPTAVIPTKTSAAGATSLPPLISIPPKFSVPHIVLADVPMSPRLLKLKAELVSIFCVIPEKAMRWGEEFDVTPDASSPRPDLGSNSSAPPLTRSSGEVVITGDDEDQDGPDHNQPVGQDNSSEVVDSKEVEKQAQEKAERKLKLLARRKAANEIVISKLRAAGSAKELFEVVNLVLAAVPPALLLGFDLSKLPRSGTSLGAVAVRIYAFDRALRYEDWKGIEQTVTQCDKPFRPRVGFSPRCVLTVACSRFLCHDGRCSNPVDVVSRFPELIDVMSSGHSSIHTGGMAASSNAQNVPGKRTREEDADDRIAKRPPVPVPTPGSTNSGGLGSGIGGGDPDSIENVQPYYPAPHEITAMVWV